MGKDLIRSILIISPEAWHAHHVSKHHYAKLLARLGHKVFFLDPPCSELDHIEAIPHQNIVNLTIVKSPRVAPALQYLPSPFRKRIESAWLDRLQGCIGVTIDVVWLFENSRFFNMGFAGERLKIYHQVDLNQKFHPHLAAKTADICFAISDYVLDELSRDNQNLYKIGHGYQVINYEGSVSKYSFKLDHSKLNALYIGNLDIPYLDFDLIESLLRNFSDICFNFIGGYSQHNPLVQFSEQYSNLVLHGKIPSDLVPQVLEQADVLLVVYLAEKYRKQLANPHKILEYLGSGKVCVASYTHEYRDLSDLIVMVESNKNYLEAFSTTIANVDYYNSEALKRSRREYANNSSYFCQLETINKCLKDSELPVFSLKQDQ